MTNHEECEVRRQNGGDCPETKETITIMPIECEDCIQPLTGNTREAMLP